MLWYAHKIQDCLTWGKSQLINKRQQSKWNTSTWHIWRPQKPAFLLHHRMWNIAIEWAKNSFQQIFKNNNMKSTREESNSVYLFLFHSKISQYCQQNMNIWLYGHLYCVEEITTEVSIIIIIFNNHDHYYSFHLTGEAVEAPEVQ